MGLAARPGRSVPAYHDAHGDAADRRIRERAEPEPPSQEVQSVSTTESSLWIYIRRFFGGQFSVSPGGQYDNHWIMTSDRRRSAAIPGVAAAHLTASFT